MKGNGGGNILKGKKIVVGVCGGIAAYKVVELVSKLKKHGAEVDVIMTKNSVNFVAPLTFQTISRNPVVIDMFELPSNWDVKHISLAEKADLMIIAPATANIIGKIASGVVDDMLTSTVIASKAPIMFVPAMNHNMYSNKIVQDNMLKLEKLGYIFLEPDTGKMACGTSGKGRLPEPSKILDKVINLFSANRDMAGTKVLVTAGPTREPIDPVRYISNRSSGKMGYAIAWAARKRGAEVTVVSGPVNIEKPHGVEVINVMTAEEMFEKIREIYKLFDVVVFAAAVSDYRVKDMSEDKIKKTDDTLKLELIKNTDIAKVLGSEKDRRIHVGFCAETKDLITNAKTKLREKNFDIIVANDITMEGAGFEVDTNIIKMIKKDGAMIEYPLLDKNEVAQKIIDEVIKLKIDSTK